MAYSKKHNFDERLTRLAGFANALSHPARIAILETLAERKSCICGEIVEVLPLAQSTVSQHLKELREIGLIKGEIEGPRSCYCIDMQRWNAMVQELDAFFEEIRAADAAPAVKCC
jgi:DNA-binding transcriptional ArsR family regulator